MCVIQLQLYCTSQSQLVSWYHSKKPGLDLQPMPQRSVQYGDLVWKSLFAYDAKSTQRTNPTRGGQFQTTRGGRTVQGLQAALACHYEIFQRAPNGHFGVFVIRVLAFWVHQRLNPKSVLQFSDFVLWKKLRKKISLTLHVSTGDCDK
jgi:hypothetical protein